MKKKLNVDDILKIIAEESVDAAYRNEKSIQGKYSMISEEGEEDEEGSENEDVDGENEESEGDAEEDSKEDPKTLDDIDLDDELDAELEKEDGESGDEEGDGKEKSEKDSGGDKKHYIQSPLILKKGEVSLEGVGSTLNMIRAGRSFGDADIAENLAKWFNSLSQAEMLTLGVFLEAIRTIAEGGEVGEIKRTSDPSVDVDVTSGEEPTIRPETPSRPGDPPKKDIEDRTAPISVGPRDITIESKIREKIKALLVY